MKMFSKDRYVEFFHIILNLSINDEQNLINE